MNFICSEISKIPPFWMKGLKIVWNSNKQVRRSLHRVIPKPYLPILTTSDNSLSIWTESDTIDRSFVVCELEGSLLGLEVPYIYHGVFRTGRNLPPFNLNEWIYLIVFKNSEMIIHFWIEVNTSDEVFMPSEWTWKSGITWILLFLNSCQWCLCSLQCNCLLTLSCLLHSLILSLLLCQ